MITRPSLEPGPDIIINFQKKNNVVASCHVLLGRRDSIYKMIGIRIRVSSNLSTNIGDILTPNFLKGEDFEKAIGFKWSPLRGNDYPQTILIPDYFRGVKHASPIFIYYNYQFSCKKKTKVTLKFY